MCGRTSGRPVASGKWSRPSVSKPLLDRIATVGRVGPAAAGDGRPRRRQEILPSGQALGVRPHVLEYDEPAAAQDAPEFGGGGMRLGHATRQGTATTVSKLASANGSRSATAATRRTGTPLSRGRRAPRRCVCGSGSRAATSATAGLVPGRKDRDVVHSVIYDELCLGLFSEASRAKYIEIIERLAAGGVVLGCTEIELLVRPDDTSVPVFPSTALRARSAVDAALFA